MECVNVGVCGVRWGGVGGRRVTCGGWGNGRISECWMGWQEMGALVWWGLVV